MQFWSLKGEQPYESVSQLQKALVESRVQERIEDTVLFLEHRAVVTRGRGLQFTGKPRPKHEPLAFPLPKGVDYCESERGGDLTYHGPGQLVIYPICKLNGEGFGPKSDVIAYIRKLEGILIDLLGKWGVFGAGARESATGVWIGKKVLSQGTEEKNGVNSISTPSPLEKEIDRDYKIASMGIAVRKWVTYHGIAINCVNDLAPFHWISPCGFSPDVMTRLADWIPLSVEEGRWRKDLENAFAVAMSQAQAAGCEPRIKEFTLEEAFREIS